MKELIKGGLTMSRVVYALSLRETRTRFGQHRLGYAWAILEPSFWILTFWGMFKIVDREVAGGMDIIPFLATGVIPYSLSVGTSDRVSSAIESNRALLFYPHVQPIDLVIARGLLEFATYTTVLAVILGSYGLWVGGLPVDSALTLMLGLALATLLGTSLGLVLCALTVISATTQRIKGPLMRPLFWVSGLFFSANMLPTNMREVLLWNPILHCTELVRDGLFPQYHAVDASPAYVMMWILGFAFVGLTLERRIRPRIQLT